MSDYLFLKEKADPTKKITSEQGVYFRLMYEVSRKF
jgi:hypothetical protein